MKLSPHDLQQLDEDALWRLPEAGLRHLALTLLADRKEARERLAQNPHNCSRPPSSRPPWERGMPADEAASLETAPAPEPVLGPTGVGITWIACAFAQQACRQGLTTRYLACRGCSRAAPRPR